MSGALMPIKEFRTLLGVSDRLARRIATEKDLWFEAPRRGVPGLLWRERVERLLRDGDA